MSDGRMRRIGEHFVPMATALEIYVCDECDHVHIIGINAHGVPFCEITLSENAINAALDAIHAAEMKGQRT